MLKAINFEKDPYVPDAPVFQFPPPYQPGLYRMGFEDYRALRLPNSSFFKEFAETPAHGLAYLQQQGKTVSPLQSMAG